MSEVNFPHLTKAPVVEALIDIRVRLAPDFDIVRLKRLHSLFEVRYPVLEEQRLLQHRIQQAAAPTASHTVTDQGLQGYLFRSADGTQVVQFRRDGFTFNRLSPYTSWGEVFPEATQFWKLYSELSQPAEISRIAVRYINRLMLPRPELNFSDYLAAPPLLPGGPDSALAALNLGPVPSMQPVSGFITRVVTQDPESQIIAAVTQALEQATDNQYVPVILDIDVFRENVSNLSADAVLTAFSALREMKNRAFFGSITTKLLDILK